MAFNELALGDPVVYKNHIIGMNEIGVVVNACKNNFKVLWNDEIQSRVEQYKQLRIAKPEEVDAQERLTNLTMSFDEIQAMIDEGRNFSYIP